MADRPAGCARPCRLRFAVRLGRLQPLVDDDRVENIIIAGHDNVMFELIDGSLVDGPPVADSDEELIDFPVFLATRSEVNARGFSELNRVFT